MRETWREGETEEVDLRMTRGREAEETVEGGGGKEVGQMERPQRRLCSHRLQSRSPQGSKIGLRGVSSGRQAPGWRGADGRRS